jgi:hypothetical protein
VGKVSLYNVDYRLLLNIKKETETYGHYKGITGRIEDWPQPGGGGGETD